MSFPFSRIKLSVKIYHTTRYCLLFSWSSQNQTRYLKLKKNSDIQSVVTSPHMFTLKRGSGVNTTFITLQSEVDNGECGFQKWAVNVKLSVCIP